MKALRTLLVVTLALAAPIAAFAQAAPAAPAITVTPYGIVQLGMYKNDGLFGTMSLKTAATSTSNPVYQVDANSSDYANYARSEEEGAFIVSARQTRFGFNVTVPTENIVGATTTGKIEADFMGGGTSWNSQLVRLRYAYMNAAWNFSGGSAWVLAGQTDGLVNPLHPESTAYLASPLFQQAGNLHRRSPQLRVGGKFEGDAFALQLEVAALSGGDGTDYGTGVRSGSPDFEARLGATLKPISGFGGTVGIGYHTNKRTYDAVAAANVDVVNGNPTEDVTAKLTGIDAVLDLTQYAQVRGEWFKGEGFDDIYAGMAQTSVSGSAGARTAVESKGYWAQLILKPIPAVYILAGMGKEEVDDATYSQTVAAAGLGAIDRSENEMKHVGLLLNMNKSWRVGLEYLKTTTTYRVAVETGTPGTFGFGDLTASQLSLSTQLRF